MAPGQQQQPSGFPALASPVMAAPPGLAGTQQQQQQQQQQPLQPGPVLADRVSAMGLGPTLPFAAADHGDGGGGGFGGSIFSSMHEGEDEHFHFQRRTR